MVKRRLALLLILFMFALASCAGMQGDVKSFTDMTPKEKATFVMSVYNKQYDSYLTLYKKGDWTDQEKEVLKVKYELLGEMETYTKLYTGYAETGVAAPAETEEALLALIDKLLAL